MVMILEASSHMPLSLRQHFVMSPQADRTLKRLTEIYEDPLGTNTSRGLLILGPSGVGKSTVIDEFVKAVSRDQFVPGKKLPILVVEIPAEPTKKTVAAALLKALNDPFADAQSHSAEFKLSRVVTLLSTLRVEMVILDEAQHLVDHKRTSTGVHEAADWVKSLMNRTSIAYVLVGLRTLERLPRANEQFRRRFSAALDYDRFQLTESKWVHFYTLLKVLHGLLPVPAIDFTTEQMVQRLHHASFGVIDYLDKILDRATWLVKDKGEQGITMAVLSEAFQDEVWNNAPEDRNPFSARFDFKPLIGHFEPFEDYDK
jgi:hypothetical protein